MADPTTAIARLLTALLCALAAGCSHTAAFDAVLPTTIDTRGKAIAIIGDLQQTAAFVRFVRRREDTAADQIRLMADLEARRDELAALIIVGDLVYSGRSARDWAHFDTLVAPFADRMTVLPAIGNHDYPCYLVRLCRTSKISAGMHERFRWLEPGTPYAVPTENVLLAFLDSESRLDSQSEWLRDRLRAAEDRFAAALVFFHRPPFSNSIDKHAQGSELVNRFVVPVLREAPVPTVVFNGHIHGFEHIERDGIHFITTAGGGGPRVAMPETSPGRSSTDLYKGPSCPQNDGNAIMRPFNYVLLRTSPDRLSIEVRGFCRADAAVRTLDAFEIALDPEGI